MRPTKQNITTLAIAATLFLAWSCANPGTKALTGGPKDEVAPVVVKSVPELYSTNFVAASVDIAFNEYLKPQTGLDKKVIISPVMDVAPEILIRGKHLLINFKSELLPDRTYTLNFGENVADLNEGNVFENFQYVFSTGDKLDSLQIGGIVRSAKDNLPLEGAVVMLYMEDRDSLPLTEIPIYLSVTNKEGRFSINNLASGSYKIFALKDGNSNYLFDLPKEEIGFLDSLITPGVRVIEKAAAAMAIPQTDSLIKKDSLELKDSLANNKPEVIIIRYPDSVSIPKSDSLPVRDSLQLTDSLPKAAPKPEYQYYPQNLEIYTFVEKPRRQFISSTARPKANKIEVLFNQALDSLYIGLLPSDSSSASSLKPQASSLEVLSALLPIISNTKDTLSIWITDTTLSQRDTLIFNFQFTGYDSLEQPVPYSDTVTFTYRKPPEKKGEKPENPFKISTNFDRTKELGQISKITFTEPWESMDTSRIRLERKQDTLLVPLEFKLRAAPEAIFDFRFSIFESVPEKLKTNDERRITNFHLENAFVPDSSYSLTFLPGAFKTYGGLTNDTTKIQFKVNSEDKYGSIKLNMEGVSEPIVLQVIKGKDQVVAERSVSESGVVVFPLLKPGKYKIMLILDRNQNGVWDPGRYLYHVQAERIKTFNKELELKANWEMEETWNLEEE